jgi:hypothetical protein
MSSGFVRLTKSSGGGGITSLEVGTTPIIGGAVGRVLFEGTGNVLQESANLFWDNTNGRLGIKTNTPLGILHLKEVGQTTRLLIDGDAGQSKIITYRTNGLQRFGLYVNNTAESGSNAGSDFAIRAYNDAGVLLSTPLHIKRSSGNVQINSTTDAGYKADINGTTRIQNVLTTVGTASSDYGQLSSELATTASGTNWVGTSLPTGYTHIDGSATPLTSTLNAVVGSYYYIEYELFKDPDIGEGTITSITFGGQVITVNDLDGIVNATSFRATVAAPLVVTPTSNFNGYVIFRIKTVTTSTASILFQRSNGSTVNELRANFENTNLFFGVNAGAFQYNGGGNVFIGNGAGRYSITGRFNTFIGYLAGNENYSGISNTFIGDQSGFGNTTGSFNTFIGDNAGFSNKGGRENTFIGSISGYSNTTGSYNIYLGLYSGYFNTTGNSNTFIGYFAGYANTASQNTFLGNNAGRNNTSGIENTYVGHQAGYSISTNSSSTIIGFQAGYGSSAGTSTFVGTQAGYNNGNSNQNTYIGYRAGYGGTSNTVNNTYVGHQVGLNQTTAYQNAILGTLAALNITTTNNMVAIGYQAARYFGNLSSNNTAGGNSGVFVGANSRPLTNSTQREIVIGIDVTGLGSDTTVIGTSQTTLTALRGNIVIGTTVNNASAILEVESTTKGFLPPRMDTTQKNAISSPPAGLIIYDTTLNKLCVRVASAWQTITSA